MAVDMGALADDTAAETEALRILVAPLDEAGWRRATPAPGWSIADQISHLAHFDEVALRAAVDPDGFRADLDAALRDGGSDPDEVAARYRHRSGTDILAWFDRSRAALLDTYRRIDPSLRVPWFGPAMSAASSLTARFMETWAHGQDVADALGAHRPVTDRIRHVVHIGVGARAYSYAAHRRRMPDAPVLVEVTAPSGAVWRWGPPGVPDRITGPALDFCLLVTQRRHPDDTALAVAGEAAREWMSIAQAFAGPPGPGRPATSQPKP
jgi:uncharacterized protein (TIGR03084 family)